VHQRKDVIGKACRVGVVLFDAQVGLVVKQAAGQVSAGMPDWQPGEPGAGF